MWEELGIAPTADPKAIRRAYGSRLRAIDPDRDPAAFQRLRQALEAALGQAERSANKRDAHGQWPVSTPENHEASHRIEQPASRVHKRSGQTASTAASEPDSPSSGPLSTGALSIEGGAEEKSGPPSAPKLLDEALVDDAEVRAVFNNCRQALEAGNVETAFRRLIEASAKGLLPLGDEDDISTDVVATAVDDLTLPGERFRFMIRLLGWDRPAIARDADKTALGEKVSRRLEAEGWYDNLQFEASKSGRWLLFVDKQKRWLARVLLGMAPRWRLAFVHGTVIEHQLEPYDRFEPWLRGRIDSRRLAWAKAASRSPARDTLLSLYSSFSVVFFGLLLLPFLLVVTRLADLAGLFGRGVKNFREPRRAAWRQDVARSIEILRAPRAFASPRGAIRSLVRIYFVVLLIMLGVAFVGLAILIPPLGMALVIGGVIYKFFGRKRWRR